MRKEYLKKGLPICLTQKTKYNKIETSNNSLLPLKNMYYILCFMFKIHLLRICKP